MASTRLRIRRGYWVSTNTIPNPHSRNLSPMMVIVIVEEAIIIVETITMKEAVTNPMVITTMV